MKYIVIKVDQGRIVREIPIIFPDDLVHKEVLDAVRTMRGFSSVPCVSAGFVSSLDVGLHPVRDGYINCYDGSASVGVNSRGAVDALLISEMDYSHGILDADGSVSMPPTLRKVLREAPNPKACCSAEVNEQARAIAPSVPNAQQIGGEDEGYVERCER